jgi:hypothetical protein
MSEIEFLRQLGDDLHAVARKEALDGPTPESGRSRWWSVRKLAAIFGAIILVGAAAVSWGLIERERPKRDGAGEVAGNPRLGGSGISQRYSGSDFWSVDASSPDDVWVSGRAYGGDTSRNRPLILHWDGRSWKEIEAPEVFLPHIAVVSPTDVWGIGGDIDHAEVLHWDGARWTRMSHRDPPGASFAGIDARSADDVWVVGTKFGAEYAPNTVGNDTLIEHWNGTRWSVLPSPNATRRGNWLNGVAALSTSNVWATGYSEDATGGPKTMTLHWDGAAWAIVPSPNSGSAGSVLWGAGTDGASGVWAFGHSWDDSNAQLEALYMRWNGKAWQIVPPPRGRASHLTPGALDGSASNDVWAVGSDATGSFLIARWDGSIWRAVKAELPSGIEDANLALHDVVAPSADEAWAVGGYQLTSRAGTLHLVEYHPVLEHWDGSQWRLVQLPVIAGS